MKKALTILLILSMSLFLVAGTAMATYINLVSWDGIGKDLKSQMNHLSTDGDIDLVGQGASDDAIALDEVCLGGTAGSTTMLILEKISGNAGANSLGIYDPYDSTKRVEIFSGSDTYVNREYMFTSGDGSVFVGGDDPEDDTGIDFASRYFGLYLDGLDAGDPFFYQSALNPEGMDQIVTFREPRRHIPPFPRGKPPSPVPEPATMLQGETIEGS